MSEQLRKRQEGCEQTEAQDHRLNGRRLEIPSSAGYWLLSSSLEHIFPRDLRQLPDSSLLWEDISVQFVDAKPIIG